VAIAASASGSPATGAAVAARPLPAKRQRKGGGNRFSANHDRWLPIGVDGRSARGVPLDLVMLATPYSDDPQRALAGVGGLTGVGLGSKISRVDADAVNAVVSAVNAGAVAGLKSTATQAVKDAYAGLKKLITDRYAQVDVTALEKRPESVAKRESLGEDLRDAGAGADEELVAAAQRVLAAVDEHDPEVAAVIGVDIAGLKAVNVRLSDITAEGSGAIGLRARDVTASGDFEASRIHATDQVGPPDPPAQ